MSTNGSRKIFEMFRTTEPFDVTDPDGNVATVLFRALNWDQNNALIRRMEQAEMRIKAEMSQTGDRALIEDAAERMTVPDVMRAVLAMERPLADESSDLAPGADTEKKEKSAVEKWEENRQKELDEMGHPDLRALFVRRQESLFIRAKAAQEFMNDSLCFMVLDPDTKKPMFSMEPKNYDGTPNKDFIGELMPEVRQQLLQGRADFLEKRGEKKVRKAAESGAFLSSGESPSPPADSPGETVETQPTSQPTP
jgi:hypothetical protein